MREANGLNDTPLFEMAARLLIGHESPNGRWVDGHCEPIIANLSRYYGFWNDDEFRVDYRQKCLSAMWEAIYEGRETKPYWEERFGRAFKMACIDVARSQRAKNGKLEAELAAGGDDASSSEAINDTSSADIETEITTELSRPHHQRIVMTAIRALPPRQAAAVTLAWVEGRPVEGEGKDTVAELMDISASAVYKHLRLARQTLKANPALREIWAGEV